MVHKGNPFRGAAIALLGAAALSACATVDNGDARVASVSKSVPAAPEAPVFSRGDVLDRTAGALDTTFGEPALTRREGKGEFRRYSLAACNLVVILYPDKKGAMRAAHADAVAQRSDAPKPDLDQCLAAGLAKGVGA